MTRRFTKYPSSYVKASSDMKRVFADSPLFVDNSVLEYDELHFRENSFTRGQSVSSIKKVKDSLYELSVIVDHSGDYYALRIGISTDDLMNAYSNPFNYISFRPEYVKVIDASSISEIPYDTNNLIKRYDSSKCDYQIRFLI